LKRAKRLSYSFQKTLKKIQNATVIKTDIFQTDCEKYKKPDLIISNPPYIKTDEIPSLQTEVLNEPKMALDGGKDGLDFYRLISEKWLELINKNGFVAVECGEEQAKDIEKLFSKECKKTYSVKDYNGTERIVIGEK
jgi:release factor glutamine methyltransferase